MLRITVGAVALLAAFVSSAQAAPADPPAIRLQYRDLDLNDPQGARDMVRRIRIAAARVCRSNPWNSGTDIGSIERFDRCYHRAVRGAVATLDRPQVSAAAGLAGSPSRAAGLATR